MTLLSKERIEELIKDISWGDDLSSREYKALLKTAHMAHELRGALKPYRICIPMLGTHRMEHW